MTTGGWLATPSETEHPNDIEEALWIAYRRDRSLAVRERLFSLHLSFAKKVATRHFIDRSRGDIEFPDLYQLACAGLLEAIDGFDPTHGVPFRSYASRRISGSVLDGIAKMSEVREQIAFRKRVRADRARSLSTMDGEVTRTEDAMQALTEIAVGLALGFMLEGTGLYAADGDAVARPNAYDSLVWKDTIRHIGREVDTLPDREQAIIRHHYLSGLNFDQIGVLLGLSKGRISQLHRAAITLLRKRMLQAHHFRLER